MRTFYADGVAYRSMRDLANAVKVPYASIFHRFKSRDYFIINGVFITRLEPEYHQELRERAEKLTWKPNRITTERRLINTKPAPLLGHGHITHGINDRFGK